MSSIPHLPALRRGKAYESLDKTQLLDHSTGHALVEISQVNAGIVRKDMARIAESRTALKRFTVAQMLEICARTGEQFLNATLPLGDKGHTQSPQQYLETLSRTSGLPHNMVRRNMQKINDSLQNMREVLNGLTRGLPLDAIDKGVGEQNGSTVCFYPRTNALGVVMPSNSPAVNSLWLPAIALKIPVILKPGREEPWTPYRLIQSFIAAGCPAEAFGFYPTDHEGSAEILRSCGRALIFGDKNTTTQYANNPSVQVHGPGYSKILIGEDEIDRWPEFIDMIVGAISDNGGRSCINASAVVVPKHAREIADALAKKLGPVAPLAPTDDNAKLSGFANAKMAEFIDATIEDGLKTSGAEDLTAKYRNGPRKSEFQGGTYLRPTIVLCDSFNHPLANKEFLCPYASVVEVPQNKMLEEIGPSLAVTAITRDKNFIDALMESTHIDRLNIGPISTMKVSWSQPHEGNMFEFLYKRRSLELASNYGS
ncbi:MAG: aldehyde dehydrogenase family protein [Limisphaerales bacterium]